METNREKYKEKCYSYNNDKYNFKHNSDSNIDINNFSSISRDNHCNNNNEFMSNRYY